MGEPRARRLTDLIFAAAALIYPAWHWIFLVEMPTACDPLHERLLVSAAIVLTALLFRSKPLRRHFEAAEQGLMFCMTTHYLSLIWRNGLATPYMVGAFVLFASTSVVFTRLLVTLLYSIYCLGAGVLMVALVDRPAPLGLEWLLGMASVLFALGIGSYRASVHRRTALLRIAGERQLLKEIIESIPDPVFVRRPDRSLVTSNDAARQFENATGYNLEEVVRHEDRALASRNSMEADVELPTLGGALSVSVKTAVTEMQPGRVLLVTVMRDITGRRALEFSLRQKVQQLEEARVRVRQLQGMLPICMHCSRIRVGGKLWETLEAYVTTNSPASFTHTVCGSCMEKHYPAEGEG